MIDEARAMVREVTVESDDDTAPKNCIDDILNDVCGYESEVSDEEVW